MARVGPLAGVDIDAIFNALRPRILSLLSGGTSAGGATGAQGPPGPKGVNWKGLWAADTNYEQGDLVYRDTTGGGASELITYYALEAHTSLTGSPPVPGGNTQWWELGNAYLIIDGSRGMTGDLNVNSHEVDNITNLNMNGGVGAAILNLVRRITMTGLGLIEAVRKIDFTGSVATEGVIDKPRVIHMAGDKADDEAKIDGLERVVFNDEPTASQIEKPSRVEWNTAVVAGTSYTAAEGKMSWDTLEDTVVVYVASGPGA